MPSIYKKICEKTAIEYLRDVIVKNGMEGLSHFHESVLTSYDL